MPSLVGRDRGRDPRKSDPRTEPAPNEKTKSINWLKLSVHKTLLFIKNNESTSALNMQSLAIDPLFYDLEAPLLRYGSKAFAPNSPF